MQLTKADFRIGGAEPRELWVPANAEAAAEAVRACAEARETLVP